MRGAAVVVTGVTGVLLAVLVGACSGGAEPTGYEVTPQASCTAEERAADLASHGTRVAEIAATLAAEAAEAATAIVGTRTSVAIEPPSTPLATATPSMGELIVAPFLCP